MEQVKLLKAQNSELEAQEKELDNQKAWLEENINLLNHDPIARTYLLLLSRSIWNKYFLKKIHIRYQYLFSLPLWTFVPVCMLQFST